ncbi:MAG: GAF domain-containing sensor histidine kinase [Anaerolineae bacterium]
MTSIASPVILSARPSRAVDGALIQVRWLLAVCAWIVIAVSTMSLIPSQVFLAWLGLLVVFNLLLTLALRAKRPPRRLPVWGLIGDFVLFAALPYLGTTNAPILFLFGLFPTLVAALRYGPAIGALIAIGLTLPYGVRAAASFLPASVQNVIPIPPIADLSIFSAGLPVVALFGAILLVGYLAQREREAVIGDTAVELDQLRQGMEGAKLFFQTADTLSQTLSYSRVLDAMLEAGTNGMPTARREDGPAIGVVLFFEANDPEKTLRVVAWRHLDRTDTQRRIPGKQGIVSKALEEGERVTFLDVTQDPELREFTTLRRCRAGVCYPLQSGLDLYGVVLLVSPAPRLPSDQHLDLMKAFTNQAAVAFQNARLYQSLREERDHIIDAESSARAKLARDLHDGPTQSLAALAMRLDYIGMLLDKEPSKAKQELNQARESTIRTGKELRELLFTLRPLTLETQGLSATLQLWAQRLRETEGVPLDVNAGDFGPEIDTKMSGTVFAVIEEAVNNARKHGKGAAIHVTLSEQDGNMLTTVQDEGPGFDLEAVEENYDRRGSLGLVNMRERARLLDGHLSIDSALGRGTRVMLIVPLGARKG